MEQSSEKVKSEVIQVVTETSPPSQVTRERKRTALYLMTAGIFLMLGLGNIIYGTFKAAEHSELLQISLRSSDIRSNRPKVPFFSSDINIDKEAEHQRRIISRIDYYNFVVLGGKCFLAIAGIFLLLFLITRKYQEDISQS